MNYREPIRQYIRDTFLFGTETALDDTASFLKEGIIDSTGILELITYIEETFQIKVEDDELMPENFDSLQNTEQFLKKKLGHDAYSSETV